MKILLIILIISAYQGAAYADVYYDQKREGWFWYKTKPLKEKIKTKKPKNPKQQTSVEKVDAIKQKTQELLTTALIEPTQENVTNYMRHQTALLEMSDKFRKEWEIALLKNPDLDYTAEHPISQVALQTAEKEEYQQQIKQISSIAKEAGIYFIFSSTCPYCIQQAKILSHFENTYGVSVFPLTLDNVGLEEYPAPQAGTQMADKLNITKTPTLILAYPASGKMIPLAAGLVTEKELIRRLIILDQKKEPP